MFNSAIRKDSETSGSSPHSSPHLEFRADIEGLRALAILIVIACHAGLPWMEGGFIGVDVFFVLSGYLISGLLIKELLISGKIDFLNFYARRLKRLLPALLIMSIGTILLSALILSPIEQISQASTVKLVPLWITNFAFSYSEINYFLPSSENNLFLHTWSLAVEEQFYLIWPVFILALFTAGKASRKSSLERQMALFFFIVFFLFLFLCIFLSYIKPLWGFYLMPSRGWQFALGALTYLLVSRENTDSAKIGRENTGKGNVYSLAGWSGLILILFGTFYLNESVVFPGFYALIPSFGAALLLFSGSSATKNQVSTLLSTRPMRFIGKISYSWYLWHWPILVLGNIVYVDSSYVYQLTLVTISLFFAMATMILIEIPLRKNQLLSQRPLITLGLSLILMLGVFEIGELWRNKADFWSNQPEQRIYGEIQRSQPMIYTMGCDAGHLNALVRACIFGDLKADKTAVLFGDSVVAQWFSGLAPPLIEQGWRFVVLTKSSCPLVDEPWFYPRIGQEYSICSIWRNAVIEELKQLKPDIIYLGSAAEYGFSSSQWQNGTQRIIKPLSEVAERIYIIAGSYRLPFDGPLCLARKEWQPEFLSSLSICSSAAGSSLDDVLLASITNVANEFDNVGVLDFNPLICPNNICASKIDDNIVYRDYQHVASSYVESITLEMGHKISEVRFIPQSGL